MPRYTATTIDVPGATTTSAAGINAKGEIVGSYVDSKGTLGFEASVTGKPAASAFGAIASAFVTMKRPPAGVRGDRRSHCCSA